MDSLELAVAVIVGIFRWIFRSLGGKRVASILSLLFFPLMLFSFISAITTGPGNNAAEIGVTLVIVALAGGLAAASIFAMWQTRFYTIPVTAFGPATNASAWISIIGGYLILVLLFGVFIFTVMIIAAAMAAVLGSFNTYTRR